MKWFKQLVAWFKRVFHTETEKKPAILEEGKRGRGRPKQEICKDVSRPVRWSAVEWEAVQVEAEQRGLTVSAFIRQSVLAQLKQPPA